MQRITRLWPLVRLLLLTWGLVSLIGVVLVTGTLAWRFGVAQPDRVDEAAVGDVAFVLNWTRLPAGRLEGVEHSFESAGTDDGDHVDAYAIRLSNIDVAELPPEDWHRGERLVPMVAAATDFVTRWTQTKALTWFPSPAEAKSARTHIYLRDMQLRGTKVTAARVILLRAHERLLYYVSVKT